MNRVPIYMYHPNEFYRPNAATGVVHPEEESNIFNVVTTCVASKKGLFGDNSPLSSAKERALNREQAYLIQKYQTGEKL